jgi:hypothetical protein
VIDIKVDRAHAIIEFIIEGPVSEGTVAELPQRLDEASQGLPARDLKIKADIRGGAHSIPLVAQAMRALHAFVTRAGVHRIAELVESEEVAIELGRIARAAGTDKYLRRFWEDDSAREWLLHGDVSPSSIGARWR